MNNDFGVTWEEAVLKAIEGLPLLVSLVPMALLPRWSRRGIYFGVSVAPEFRESATGRRIYRQYLGVLLTVAAGYGGFLAFSRPGNPWTALLPVGGFLLAYARGRQQTLPHRGEPALTREATLERSERPVFGGWWGWAAAALLPVLAALYIAANWEAVPDPMPMHYDAAGRVNRWAPKSVEALLPMALLAASLNLLLPGMAYAIAQGRKISPEGTAEASESQRRQGILRVLLASHVFSNLILAMVALAVTQLVPAGMLLYLAPAGAVGLTVYSVWFSNRMAGQRQQQEPEGDGYADEHWVLGMFYFNRQDASVLVEQRLGIGYTFNFGNPIAWAMLGVLLAPIGFLILRGH